MKKGVTSGEDFLLTQPPVLVDVDVLEELIDFMVGEVFLTGNQPLDHFIHIQSLITIDVDRFILLHIPRRMLA